MSKSGVTFHCHHGVLFEYCYDYDERVRYIKKHKPKDEQELRLRLFKMIPEDRLSQDGLKAYDKAREAYVKAWEAYDKAREAYRKAREAYDKAQEAYIKKNSKALNELHNELCPDCPWDGKTIFSKR